MGTFLETYKSYFIYGIAVIITVFLLRLLTNKIHNFFFSRKQELLDSGTSIHLIKRILNALWLVLGVIALRYIFVDKNNYGALQEHFFLVLYLGFLAILTIVATTTTNIWFRKKIRQKVERNDDPTAFNFLRYVVVVGMGFTGIVFGLLAFPSLQGVAQTALGGVGVLTLIVGVASQEALSNLIGGVFIIVFKPFKIGDIIKVTDIMVGTVTDITLRHTVICNFEHKMIVIPNSVISKEKLINYNLGELKCCERIEVGISYDSNVKLAKKIMQEECEKHPFIYDNRTEIEIERDEPIVRTALLELNDFSVTIRAWAWASNFEESFFLRCDVLETIKERFEKEGIEIPYPYRTIVMKKDMKTNG